MRFWRRNLAFCRLAVLTNLEYRFNYFTDAILQPACTSLIEVTLWYAVFAAAGANLIGGFPLESYLSYALWSSFVARITSNWMYEFRMSQEIESGTINSILTRPFSFYEYYLSQLIGYKGITTLFSFLAPIAAVLIIGLPTDFSKLPIVLVLIAYYTVFLHTLSFCVSTVAFHLNRISSLTVAKNLALWILSGELVPLDLMPNALRQFFMVLPFSNAVYVPVGYLTGRVTSEELIHGFVTTTYGLVALGAVAYFMWQWGLRKYVGTGA